MSSNSFPLTGIIPFLPPIMGTTSFPPGMYIGSALLLDFSIFNLDGSIYDLTGVSGISWSMSGAYGASALISKSYTSSGSASGITITSPSSAGLCEVTIDAVDSVGLDAGAYCMQMLITDGNNNEFLCYSSPIIVAASNLGG